VRLRSFIPRPSLCGADRLLSDECGRSLCDFIVAGGRLSLYFQRFSAFRDTQSPHKQAPLQVAAVSNNASTSTRAGHVMACAVLLEMAPDRLNASGECALSTVA
jgi:hypothetical protein